MRRRLQNQKKGEILGVRCLILWLKIRKIYTDIIIESYFLFIFTRIRMGSVCLILLVLSAAVTPIQIKPIVVGLITKCEHRNGAQNAMGMLISQHMKVYTRTILRNVYLYREFDVCEEEKLYQVLVDLLLDNASYINSSVDSLNVKHLFVYMPEKMYETTLNIISFTDIAIWPLQDLKESSLMSGMRNFAKIHLIHKMLPHVVIARLLELFNWKNVHIVDVLNPEISSSLSPMLLRERIPDVCFSYNKISIKDMQKPNVDKIYSKLKDDKGISVVFVLGQMAGMFKEMAFRKGVRKYWVIFSKYRGLPGKGRPEFLSILNSDSVINSYFLPFSNKTVCHPSFIAYQNDIGHKLLCKEPQVINLPEFSLNEDVEKYSYTQKNMLPNRCIAVKRFRDNEDYRELRFFQYPRGNKRNPFYSFSLISRPHLETSKGSKCPEYKVSENNCVTSIIREVKSIVFDKQYKYACQICQPNHFIDTNGKCHECLGRTRTNVNKTKCYDPVLPFKPYYSCYILCGLGLLVTTFTLIVYIIFRKTPVVKCSNFELSMIQLIACNLLLVSFFIFMKEPTVSRCTLRPVTLSTLIVIIVSIVVGKAEKILIIFFTKTRLTKKDIKDIWMRQIVIFGFLLIVNFIIIPAAFTLPATVGEVKHHQNDDGDWFVLIECSTDQESYVLLIYAVVILLLSIIQGYRGRKLPANYNEGTSISIAASCLLFALTFCIWAMNGNNTVYQKVYIVWMALSVGLIFLILCLYGPKVFVILFQATRNTRTYQMNLMLVDALKKAEKEMLMPSRKRAESRLHLHDLSYPSPKQHNKNMKNSHESLQRFRAFTIEEIEQCELFK